MRDGYTPAFSSRISGNLVVIGGQSLTLLVTPMAYSLFDDLAAAIEAIPNARHEMTWPAGA